MGVWLNSAGKSLASGVAVIWNGGWPTRAAFLFAALVLTAGLAVFYKLLEISWRSIRRRRRPETFLVSGTEAAHIVSVATSYLDSKKDALSKMRTNQQIALETTGLLKQVIRGKLQRRTSFAKNEIGLSKSAFEELTGQPWIEGVARAEIKLVVRAGYSLFNHPDDAIRISSWVTLWVTLFNLAMGGFFWWLPHGLFDQITQK